MEESSLEQRARGRSFQTVLARKAKHLQAVAEAIDHGDHIVTCCPIAKDGSVCLIAFRDHGDTVFDADVVTLGVYICMEVGVMLQKSVMLHKRDPVDDEPWPDRLRNTCRTLCGSGNNIHRLRTFFEIRHDMEMIGTILMNSKLPS